MVTKKIATHNASSGEPSRSFWHHLMTFVAKCQTLSIAEQYEVGCTYFDLRVREIDWQGHYRLCHGLWESKTTLHDVLDTLTLASFEGDKPYVSIFYEGRFESEFHRLKFIDDMLDLRNQYKNVEFVVIGVKKPEWKELQRFSDVYAISKFTKIVGWKVLFPFPFFWWAITPDTEFNDYEYQMVDFL